MAEDAVSMVVSMSLDVPAIAGRLVDDELRILRAHQREIVEQIKASWTGWKYEGRDPKSVGRSRAAWKGRVQATQTPFALVISNMARGYYDGKPYVTYVARRKGGEPEHIVVFKWLVFARLPLLEADLTDAIQKNIGAPRIMKRLRTNRGGARKSITL